MLIEIIFTNIILPMINLSRNMIDLIGNNKYELENGKYQLTYKNNKVVIDEDTIPAGAYKMTAKVSDEMEADQEVILDNEYQYYQRKFSYIEDPQVRNILKNIYIRGT